MKLKSEVQSLILMCILDVRVAVAQVVLYCSKLLRDETLSRVSSIITI